jgi:hypothetical protein
MSSAWELLEHQVACPILEVEEEKQESTALQDTP